MRDQDLKQERGTRTAQKRSLAHSANDQRSESSAHHRLQHMASHFSANQQENTLQEMANHTGMPDTLKTNMESISGQSLDDVRVHYNSSKPAQLQAKAYAQGSNIYLGTGQEQHLPHEAWHVVQQKSGRVKPTSQHGDGIAINDDPALEQEADVMGAKAMQFQPENDKSQTQKTARQAAPPVSSPAQCKPQNRYEYKEAVGFFEGHVLPPEAADFIRDLETYSSLEALETPPVVINRIGEQIKSPKVMEALRKAAVPEGAGKFEKTQWHFIKQHLENGTTDELNEYAGWRTRWGHRASKYGALPISTLAVQSGMQFAMGNPISGGAFLTRGALVELKLMLTHGVSLKSKLASPIGWKRGITGVSTLSEVAKFFETWTPKGIVPGGDASDWVKASNYIKKIRASVMGLRELPKLYFDYDLALGPPKTIASTVEKTFKMGNAIVGEVENILNFINIGLSKHDEDTNYNIVNNIAKLIRHVVDFIRLLIECCKTKAPTSDLQDPLIPSDEESQDGNYGSTNRSDSIHVIITPREQHTMERDESSSAGTRREDVPKKTNLRELELEQRSVKNEPEEEVSRPHPKADLKSQEPLEHSEKKHAQIAVVKAKSSDSPEQEALQTIRQMIAEIHGSQTDAVSNVYRVFEKADEMYRANLLPERTVELIKRAWLTWKNAKEVQKKGSGHFTEAEGLRMVAMRCLYEV